MGVFKKGKSWYIDYWHNYKRYRESIGPGTKRDAEKALAKRKVQIKEKRFFNEKTVTEMTFDEMVSDFLEYSKAHKKSYESDKNVTRRLIRFFGGSKVSSILPSDIDRYKDFRQKTISNNGKPVAVSTINRELSCLKTMFNRLCKDRKLEFNPIQGTKFFDEEHLQRDRVLTEAELNSLLKNCNTFLRQILQFAYYSGMRRAEILNLTWEKVDFKNNYIELSHTETKSGRKRSIPLHENLINVLKERLTVKEGPHVFHREGKKIISIREGFERACKRAGIKDMRFHDLRHMAITRWYKAGVPEAAIMSVSGHRTRKVFDRYVNLKKEDLRDMFSKLN